MKISVITSFYKGNIFMPDYFRCLAKNQQNLQCELEVILVNDSPEEDINTDGSDGLNLKLIGLDKNSGIHFARVAGLKESTGDYILFLDQDDKLSDDALEKMRKKAEEGAELIVSNAELEQKEDSVIWYRTDYHKSVLWDKQTYLRIGNQIMSPGQCLIERSRIPLEWCNNVLKNNCCDDYYLWLLMLDKVSACYIDEPLYIHSYTGNNVSADAEITYVSSMEMIHYLRREQSLTDKDIKILYKMIDYKYAFKQVGKIKKIILSLCNFSVAVNNIIYKKKTKTPYGFNRY